MAASLQLAKKKRHPHKEFSRSGSEIFAQPFQNLCGNGPKNFTRMDTKEQKMIVLAEYGQVMEAELALSRLQAGGIEARIDNEYAATLYPTGALPARLTVRSGDARRAAELLGLPASPETGPQHA